VVPIANGSSVRKRRALQRGAIQRCRENLNESKREAALATDDFVLSFTESEVTCAACRGVYKLDDRRGARFYLGFWKKHKRLCQGIEAIVGFWLPREIILLT
jgi:hypothetical protein